LGRLGVAAVLGCLAAAAAGWWGPWQAVPLVFWVVAALAWLAGTWITVAGTDARATRRLATAEDPHGPTADSLLVAASVGALIAVVLGILKAAASQGTVKLVLLTAGVAAIVTSWGVVHTVFMLRYAALYYGDPPGGVDFNEDDRPCYADFAYLALTIGMTYQVSDTDLGTKAIRRTATRHAVLSYVLGTIIIAATINISAGLAK
jgi:uncharacterized membrane protein